MSPLSPEKQGKAGTEQQNILCPTKGRQRGAQAALTDGEDVLLLFGDLAVLQQQSSNGLENTWRENLTCSAPNTTRAEPTVLPLEPFKQISQAGAIFK